MTPIRTIVPLPWMISPETLAVLSPLNDGQAEPMALFVGGCVRNMLLGIPVGDIDIATKWTPQQVIEKLERAGLKVIPTGLDHGTVTAVSAGRPYEITTLRRDVETDGRRAVIAFSQSWSEDAQRRDFTMNTLLADGTGRIFDPTGQGLRDLEAGRVVFVGDPAQRIAEDVLRILRFFRFHALYGRGEPDQPALQACAAQAHKIASLSRERMTQEFFRILSVDKPMDVLRIIFNNRILSFLGDDNQFIETIEKFCEKAEKITIAGRLYILAGASVDKLRSMEDFLIFPKALWREILAMDAVINDAPWRDAHRLKRCIYHHGREPVLAALDVDFARARFDGAIYPDLRSFVLSWPVPVFPVTGDDLIKQGVIPGPELGSRLRLLEDSWIESGFDDSILR